MTAIRHCHPISGYSKSQTCVRRQVRIDTYVFRGVPILILAMIPITVSTQAHGPRDAHSQISHEGTHASCHCYVFHSNLIVRITIRRT